MKWINITERLPEDDRPVLTKIHEPGNIERNVQVLKRSGTLWFLSDGSMYVYYTPTHWMEIKNKNR